jgi:hypothetical protein
MAANIDSGALVNIVDFVVRKTCPPTFNFNQSSIFVFFSVSDFTENWPLLLSD